ncbi:MAG: L,D-transpeptidase family protein [Lachnospiraceae bacterium]
MGRRRIQLVALITCMSMFASPAVATLAANEDSAVTETAEVTQEATETPASEETPASGETPAQEETPATEETVTPTQEVTPVPSVTEPVVTEDVTPAVTEPQQTPTEDPMESLAPVSPASLLEAPPETSTEKETWKEIDGQKCYYDQNGRLVRGWVMIDKIFYYFNPETGYLRQEAGLLTLGDKTYYVTAKGTLFTGLRKINGQMYFFNLAKGNIDNAYMAKGQWVTMKGKRYYATKSGVLRSGWLTYGGKTYYFNDDYSMHTGWLKTQEGKYNFDESGAMRTKWYKTPEGLIYYFRKDGRALQPNGLVTLAGHQYYMNAGGVLCTGFRTINGKLVYFPRAGNSPGKSYMLTSQWFYTQNAWYYATSTGQLKKGWATIDGKVYYLNSSYKRVSGITRVNGRIYCFNADGVRMQSQWFQLNGKTYYAKKNHAPAAGWITFGGYKRYFNPKSYVVYSGLRTLDGVYYIFGSKGEVYPNQWVTYNGAKYYTNSDGSIKRNEWLLWNGGWYFLRNNGTVATNMPMIFAGMNGYVNGEGRFYQPGWVRVDGALRYSSANGYVTGWNYIDGRKYFFDIYGNLVQDVRNMVSGPYKIEVNRKQCMITVFARDTNGVYSIVVKAFACSVGMPSTPTPTGNYTTTRSNRWKMLMGPSWGQYATHVTGGIYFHSVAGLTPSVYNVIPGEYNKLGGPASHGCIRLTVADAKWIYDNVGNGSPVVIFDSNDTGIFDKPATIKIPGSQNWDPTDPAV